MRWIVMIYSLVENVIQDLDIITIEKIFEIEIDVLNFYLNNQSPPMTNQSIDNEWIEPINQERTDSEVVQGE